ncbi:MAG TPA: GNAT family N-acetyltransferase [Pyrinomonadaceae bacterium]|nr:GNAT family N-acetyltransferase [Pyrinomonadaceae bacterium]
MDIEVIGGNELTAGQQQLWSRLQRADESLASPYFSAQFTRAVAAVRDDLFVGVLKDGGETVGFFPFQRDETRAGRPAGDRFSDYHGIIAREPGDWTAEDLLDGCGLVRWDFKHLIASQRLFQKYHSRQTASPALDLSQGYEAYAEAQRRGGSQLIKKIETCRRKFEREVGALRFESHVADGEVLRELVEGKSAQLTRTGKEDSFSWGWTRRLLELIHATQEEDFAGMLSVLCAGDEVVAAHMGMRSRSVWHYWFPCYSRKFSRYSPGLILLLEMARSAESLGVRLIDLGRGDDLYKRRFMNAATTIAEGAVALHEA